LILAVAIKTPLYQTFAYKSEEKIAVGCRVRVNFSGREVIGVVWEYLDSSEFQLKDILVVIDDTPVFSSEVIALINFAAKYYMQPLGEMVFAALPKKLRLGAKETIKKPIKQQKYQDTQLNLNNEQQQAIATISHTLGQYQAFLLHGVTGSGKTEVYLQIAQKVLTQHKQVLVLVPEIGLTPQMVKRFASRLNAKVGVYHSGLNITQKLDNYLSAKYNECQVILGTRSAIWTNFNNLGLIIIDEEHDNSFKQNSTPRYNAKNLAIFRAKNLNIPIILGSATPSSDIFKALIDNKITHLTLTQRASGHLPQVRIINTKPDENILSIELITSITQQLANNKQVMLFINRRGYAPIYFCRNCGYKESCLSCDKEMIYHLDSNKLKCHLCEKTKHPSTTCPECGEHNMQVLGYGTQRIEQNLLATFKGIDIIRIDRDSTTKKNEFNAKLKRINSGEKCIIIGTQILAKGHDFQNVSLVGVLDVDYALVSTHFRATEELMQLLIQVAGRAGRADCSSQVLIQTNYPENPLFNYVKAHNYALFIKQILTQRNKALMPPFSHKAQVVANSNDETKAKEYLVLVKQILDKLNIDNLIISPALPSVIFKKADNYYYEINLYAQNYNYLYKILTNLLANLPKLPHKVRFYLDVDPL
jgi:primosomal protein N' (replication factor Y)